MRMIFEFPAENAKIADWVAERGGFETPGSCRAYSTQLGPKRARYSRMKKMLRVFVRLLLHSMFL
jgi:hypothetical protein